MKTKKIYLDLETGGVEPSLHSILSIAVRDKETNRTLSQLIKPQDNKCIDQEALYYNGIELEKNIKEGLSLRTTLDEVDFNYIGNSLPHLVYLIGWKVEFDYRFLVNAFKENNKILPPIVLIDVKKIAKEKYPELFKTQKYVNQLTFYKYLFKEKPIQREDKALTDIDMTQRIYEHLEDL